MNNIFIRRSVREYNKNLKVEDEKVTKLLKAAMQSPSGMNQQPWEFIVVNDEALLNKMQANIAKRPLETAPLVIVMVANKEVRAPHYIDQDMGACAQTLLLEAVNLDLAACWVSVRAEEINSFLTKEFEIPQNKAVFAMITVGYPVSEDANHFVDRFNEEKIQYNK